jgi:hypothetical protein
MGQGQGHSITLRSGMADSTIFIKNHVQQTFSSLLQVYDGHQKVMSYNGGQKMRICDLFILKQTASEVLVLQVIGTARGVSTN